MDWIRFIPSNKSQNASFLSLASAITQVHNYCLPCLRRAWQAAYTLFAFWVSAGSILIHFLHILYFILTVDQEAWFYYKNKALFLKGLSRGSIHPNGPMMDQKERKSPKPLFFLGLRTWPDHLTLTYIFTKAYVPHKMILTFSHHIPSIFVLSCGELRYTLKSLCAIKFYNIFITPTN